MTGPASASIALFGPRLDDCESTIDHLLQRRLLMWSCISSSLSSMTPIQDNMDRGQARPYLDNTSLSAVVAVVILTIQSVHLFRAAPVGGHPTTVLRLVVARFGHGDRVW